MFNRNLETRVAELERLIGHTGIRIEDLRKQNNSNWKEIEELKMKIAQVFDGLRSMGENLVRMW